MQVHLSVMSKLEAKQKPCVFDRLMHLTNGRLADVEIHGSGMRVAMSADFGFRDGICIIARDNTGLIVGWSLVEKQLLTPDHQIAVYVAHEHRRKGIGSMLVRRAQRELSGQRIICSPTLVCGRFYDVLKIPEDDWEMYDYGTKEDIKPWIQSLHK